MLYRSICPLVVWSHTIQDEVVNSLAPSKYTVMGILYSICMTFFRMQSWHKTKQDVPV